MHHDPLPQEPTSVGGRAAEVITDAASIARNRARAGSSRMQEFVRDHPLFSVGVAISGGMVLGALGHKLLEHQTSLGEALADRIGVNRLRERVRRSI